MEDTVIVYTDGACTKNGFRGASAGIGVYFGEGDQRNISRRVEGDKQTNNVAELTAILEALNVLQRRSGENKKRIIIYTDSEYSIKCCTSYGKKLEKTNWLTKKNDEWVSPPNVGLVRELYMLCNQMNVHFEHVRSHTNLTDCHSIGNFHADRLANEAIGLQSCPYQENTSQEELIPKKIQEPILQMITTPSRTLSKIYLNVSYQQKENAKQLGAKWDATKKAWYIYNDNEHVEELTKLYGIKEIKT